MAHGLELWCGSGCGLQAFTFQRSSGTGDTHRQCMRCQAGSVPAATCGAWVTSVATAGMHQMAGGGLPRGSRHHSRPRPSGSYSQILMEPCYCCNKARHSEGDRRRGHVWLRRRPEARRGGRLRAARPCGLLRPQLASPCLLVSRILGSNARALPAHAAPCQLRTTFENTFTVLSTPFAPSLAPCAIQWSPQSHRP